MSDVHPTRLKGWQERFSVQGRVALVTGAGGGIGRALAWSLAQGGATVAGHDRRIGDLAPARDLLESSGLSMTEHEADLVSVDACQRLIADVHARHGRLDVLVNCAGTNTRAPIEDVDVATFERIVGVDLRAPYFLSQAAYGLMREQGGGSIVNIGSINTFFALATVSVYGLSKAGLSQFTRAAAVEWAPHAVRVNCIAPGFIHTPINAEAVWADEGRRGWLLNRVPMDRPGQPDDLVGALLFLASDASAFITGQTIVVDGGFLAGGSWDRQITQPPTAGDRAEKPST